MAAPAPINMSTFLGNFATHVVRELSINPADVENFGVKNIHYYRNLSRPSGSGTGGTRRPSSPCSRS
jgi:hypothetical protein